VSRFSIRSLMLAMAVMGVLLVIGMPAWRRFGEKSVRIHVNSQLQLKSEALPLELSGRPLGVTPFQLSYSLLPKGKKGNGAPKLASDWRQIEPLGMAVDSEKVNGATRAFLYVPASGTQEAQVDTPFGPVALISVQNSFRAHTGEMGEIEFSVVDKREWYSGLSIGTAAAGQQTRIHVSSSQLAEKLPRGRVRVSISAGGFRERYDVEVDLRFDDWETFRSKMERGEVSIELPEWPAGEYWATCFVVSFPNDVELSRRVELKPIWFTIR
jgi:hypothetical protein